MATTPVISVVKIANNTAVADDLNQENRGLRTKEERSLAANLDKGCSNCDWNAKPGDILMNIDSQLAHIPANPLPARPTYQAKEQESARPTERPSRDEASSDQGTGHATATETKRETKTSSEHSQSEPADTAATAITNSSDTPAAPLGSLLDVMA